MLLANVVDVPDWTTAVSGLIGIGVGIDYALLVLTRFRVGDERRQGPPRRGGRGGDDRRSQRDHRRRHGGDRGARALPDRPPVHVRRRDLRVDRRARRDARRDHAAAGAALLSGPAGRPPADPVPRPHAEGGGRRRVAGRALEPRGPAPAVAVRDRRHRDPARPGRARARHAPRLPRRRQRPAGHDDPPGLRPEHRGLRARHQRPAGDRRRAPRLRAAGEIDALATRPARRGRGRVRHRSGHQRGGQRGDPHRDPDDVAPGCGDLGAGQPAARRRCCRSLWPAPGSPRTSAA